MFNPLDGAMTTVIRIKKRSTTNVNGAQKAAYADATVSPVDVCQWKGKGGSESVQGGVLTYDDTAEVVMWYRSDITIWDQVLKNDDATLVYDIISPPENIGERGKFLMFKVRRAGGA